MIPVWTGWFIFIFFTRNSTIESAFTKELAFVSARYGDWISVMLMKYGCQAFTFHVGGTRLMAQWGVLLSRVAFNEGLHYRWYHFIHQLSKENRNWLNGLKVWQRIKDNKSIFFTLDDWYERGHDIVDCCWSMRPDNHEVTPSPRVALTRRRTHHHWWFVTLW